MACSYTYKGKKFSAEDMMAYIKEYSQEFKSREQVQSIKAKYNIIDSKGKDKVFSDFVASSIVDKFNNSESGLEAYKTQVSGGFVVKVISSNIKEGSVGEEFFQLDSNNTTTQIAEDRQRTLELLDKTEQRLEDPTYDGTENSDRYKDKELGRIVKRRPSDASKRDFEKSEYAKSRTALQEHNDNLKAAMGTNLHKLYQNIVDYLVNGKKAPSKPGWLTDSQYQEIQEGVKELVKQAQAIQTKINPLEKAVFRLEGKIYDEGKDIAGSMDILVLYSDNTVSVYDWKNIGFKTENGVVTQTEVSAKKEKSYNMQMSEYKRILREVYGVKAFRETRVIPTNVQYKAGPDKKLLPIVKRIEIGGDREYLKQVPLAGEMTDNNKLNESLKRFIKIKENIDKKLRKDPRNERLVATSKRLRASIKSIQLGKDVNAILDEIATLVRDTNTRISAIKGEADYIEDLDLYDLIGTLEAYSTIVVNSSEVMKELKKTDPEKHDKTLERLEVVGYHSSKLIDALRSEMAERIKQEAEESGIKGIQNPQKEMGFFEKQFNSISQVNHPIVQRFYDYIKDIIAKRRDDVNKLTAEIQVHTEALKSWGAQVGRSGLTIYEPLINPETGNLITMFSKEYWTALNKARRDGDTKWLKENLQPKKDWEVKYEELKKKKFEEIEYFHRNSGATYIAERKDLWVKENHLSKETAWTNKFNPFLEVKEHLRDKWHSSEYKYILQPGNKALLDFYNFHIEKVSEWRTIIPVKLNANFVANVQKDTIDNIAQSGLMSIKNLGKSIIEGLEVREHDLVYGSTKTITNPNTGEEEFQIPLLYTDELDVSKKSIDLGRSLLLFGNMVSNYQHTSEIEPRVKMLRELLHKQEQILTDSLGRVIKDDNGDLKTALGNNNARELFDAMVNYYIYGKKIQDKDKIFQLFGKDISASKLLLQAMNYFSAKALAFSPVGGVVNLVGAKANSYMTGAKGIHYTNAQIRQAHTYAVSNSDKYNAITGYFELSQEDLTLQKANNLSLSSLVRNATMEKVFIVQSKGDEFVENSVLVAMMQNHGIDKAGKVVKIKTLPEGSKSLWDLTTLDEKTDKIKIEGLTEEAYKNFRNKVRYVAGTIKGSSSKEDIMVVQTHLMGRAIMQFRNWMPKMAKERFGDLKYNRDSQEYELGRYKIFVGELLSKNFVPLLTEFTTNLVTFGYGGKFNTFNADRAKEFYAKELALWEAAGNSKKDFISFEEFAELRKSQLRAMAIELKMWILVLAVLFAMGGDWDDDGKKDYRKYAITRYAYKLLDRTNDELGFFFSPGSAEEILKRPVPIFGLGIDIKNLLSNTLDESRDAILGENSKRDKRNAGYYTMKMFPFTNSGRYILDIFEDNSK